MLLQQVMVMPVVMMMTHPGPIQSPASRSGTCPTTGGRRRSCPVRHVEQRLRIAHELVHVPLASDLLHDSFLIVISQAARQLVVVHGRAVLLDAPAARYLLRFDQLELHAAAGPRDAAGALIKIIILKLFLPLCIICEKLPSWVHLGVPPGIATVEGIHGAGAAVRFDLQ